MTKYTNSLHLFDSNSFAGFCHGWSNPLSSNKLYDVLSSSYAFVIAYDSETLKPTGFVNAISDGVLSAYIPLLEVLPEHQNNGIGKKLVQILLERLDHLYMVDLCCDESLESFCKPVGFTALKGMVRRNYGAL